MSQRFQAKVLKEAEIFCDGVLGRWCYVRRAFRYFRCLTPYKGPAMMARCLAEASRPAAISS